MGQPGCVHRDCRHRVEAWHIPVIVINIDHGLSHRNGMRSRLLCVPDTLSICYLPLRPWPVETTQPACKHKVKESPSPSFASSLQLHDHLQDQNDVSRQNIGQVEHPAWLQVVKSGHRAKHFHRLHPPQIRTVWKMLKGKTESLQVFLNALPKPCS